MAGHGATRSDGRRFPLLRAAIVVTVLVAGLVGAAVAYEQGDDQRDDDVAEDADRAATLLTVFGDTLNASLSGTAAVVDADGAIDDQAFAAFANQLLAPGGDSALAFEPVVAAADRAAFEARIGRPITDRPDSGPVPAPERPEHVPVLSVVPATERSDQLIGFDLMGDPVRAAAVVEARDSGTTVFTPPVPSEPTGQPAVFVIKPIYRLGSPTGTVAERQANILGFVSTVFGTDTLADAMTLVLPADTDFVLRDGDQLLATSDGDGDGDGDDGGAGVERAARVANRQWTVTIAAPDGNGIAVPVLVLLLTGAIAGGLVFETIRSSRRQRRQAVEDQRTRDLAVLAGGLATLTSTDDVMTFLTTAVLAPLGAVHAAVAVLEGDQLRRWFTPGPRTEAAGGLLKDVVPAGADMPLAQAARTGDAVLIPDVTAVRDRYPKLIGGWSQLGFAATANLPLRDREGQLLGALGVAWDRTVDFAELQDLLATVSGIAGQTIDRARLSDAEHRVVSTMQEVVLTPLPAFAGLDLAQRYLPAVEHFGMGGDWYEGIALDDRRYLVVVGDVAGHGIAAVASMARLRSTIGTVAALGTPIEAIFPLTTALPQTGELVVATAAVIEVDLEAGRVRYVCAGHLPPLVRRPDGGVDQLDGGRQPVLGVAMPDHVVGEVDFPAGSTLVCFTDGLIERYDEGIDVSLERLVGALAESDAVDADALAGDLLARSLAGQPTDDVVLVVMRRTF